MVNRKFMNVSQYGDFRFFYRVECFFELLFCIHKSSFWAQKYCFFLTYTSLFA